MTETKNPPTRDHAKIEVAIRKRATSYPETTEHSPWGYPAFKVRGKGFLFLSASADGLSFSLKLPESALLALACDFAVPTGYGLGKSGWVTSKFAPGVPVPLDLAFEWIEESYLAIAPAKLRKLLVQPEVSKTAKKTAKNKPSPR